MFLKVSAFSTWEKELHKIVFDPRYLLLTSKERKQVFDSYVKERAEEERQERRRELKKKREAFLEMLSSASLTSKSVLLVHTISVYLQTDVIFSCFVEKYANHILRLLLVD